MTGKEFEDLKTGDVCILLKEIRVGDKVLLPGTEVTSVAKMSFESPEHGGSVYAMVDGIFGPTKMSYEDLAVVKTQKALEFEEGTKDKDPVDLIMADGDIYPLKIEEVFERLEDHGSNIFIALPIDRTNGRGLLETIHGKHLFFEIRK